MTTFAPVDTPATRLRRTTAAVRVHFRWWGTHKTLTATQKEEVGVAYAADVRLLTAGKRLVDIRHERFRALTALKGRITGYWRSLTLPYVEPGVRLIRQDDVNGFVAMLERFRAEMRETEEQLDEVFDHIRTDARARLGRLYDPADYPPRVCGLFDVSWDFPSVEPPQYLMRLHPDLYRQEQERVAQRFAEAVQLAEQAFVAEFGKLVSHLTERLGGSGETKIFRDSAVTNLTEFFERFRRLNVGSNAELDALVDRANDLVRGVTPHDLRGSDSLRQRIAAGMTQVQTRLDGFMVAAPRRRLIRPAALNGVDHAAAS